MTDRRRGRDGAGAGGSDGDSRSVQALVAHADRLLRELAGLSDASQVAISEGEDRLFELFSDVLASRAAELARVQIELEQRL